MKSTLFILLITASNIICAQNLVPNYSFEQYDTCPYNQGQICFAIPWFQPWKLSGYNACNSSSSDYYNKCSSNLNNSIPKNYIGYQQPRTGTGYSGVVTSTAPQTNEYREYIETKLSDSLMAGKKYCVEFYVSLANGTVYAADAMGLYFSKDSILNIPYKHLPYVPQIANTAGNFLTDTLNWMKIAGTFIANGGEKFITIGNFVDSANTNLVVVDSTGGWGGAYYYIDDVSVLDSSDVGINEQQENIFVTVYPNPTGSNINIYCSVNPKEIFITDIIGQRIFTSRNPNERKINISFLPPGICFLNVRTEQGTAVRKIIKE